MTAITTVITRRVAIIGITVAAAALVGCGGGPDASPRPSTAAATSTTPATHAATTTATPASTDPVGVHDGPHRAVSLVDELVVLDRPDGAPVATVAAVTAFGSPTVLGVVAPPSADGWVEVLVPSRPNELRGWVSVTDVRVEPLVAEVFVDLGDRTLRLVEDGVTVGEWPIAIGRPDRPTPTGRYFVTDTLATGDPGSVWGSYALGISAYSEALTEFMGGIGQIGIHGTNDPSSIGQDASSGCIRLPNEVIDALADQLPLGTPVVIE